MTLPHLRLGIIGLIISLLVLIALALAWGGPRPIAPLASINAPFAHVDFSTLPKVQRFHARDATDLAYRRYLPAGAPNGRRIVLLHGSSASSRSMHPLALALATAGWTVDALDVRGHGDSSQRGRIDYLGQLEDDLEDFMRATPFDGPSTLLGLSAGGGFALRFAADARATLFSHYVLLAPFLGQDAPTAKPGLNTWASVGVPRIVALQLLNALGIRTFNHLAVTEFALDARAREFLTPSYDFNLATNYRPHLDFQRDLRAVRQPMQVLVGADDELFLPQAFAPVLTAAGLPNTVTVVPGVDHIGMSLAPPALAAVVHATQQIATPQRAQ